MLYGKGHALRELRPGAHFSINHLCNDEIVGYSHPSPPPCDEEIVHMTHLLNSQEAMRQLRSLRDRMLDVCDFVLVHCFKRCDRRAWLRYMQELRDLPEHASPRLDKHGTLDLASVEMPEPPVLSELSNEPI